MKKLLLAVSAMTLMMSGIVFAQAETSVIDQRQDESRSADRSGDCERAAEQARSKQAEQQQEHVNKMEDRAMSDGVMTKRERARVGAAQNRASHHIARRNTTAKASGIGDSKLCGD